MDCMVSGVEKSQTRLSDFHFTSLHRGNKQDDVIEEASEEAPVNWILKVQSESAMVRGEKRTFQAIGRAESGQWWLYSSSSRKVHGDDEEQGEGRYRNKFREIRQAPIYIGGTMVKKVEVKVAQSCLTVSPWASLGQNTGVGSLSPLQGIFPTQASNPGLLHCRQILYQLSHKGSPRILEWIAYPFSRGSSWPRNQTRVSCMAGGFFTNWAIREAPSGKEASCQNRRCKRHKLDPGSGRFPWRRVWQPTLFSPGEAYGKRSLSGYSPWGCIESDTTEAI